MGLVKLTVLHTRERRCVAYTKLLCTDPNAAVKCRAPTPGASMSSCSAARAATRHRDMMSAPEKCLVASATTWCMFGSGMQGVCKGYVCTNVLYTRHACTTPISGTCQPHNHIIPSTTPCVHDHHVQHTCKSTSLRSGVLRVCTCRIFSRAAASGGGTLTSRSNLPGRKSAGSMQSGRLVAANTTT